MAERPWVTPEALKEYTEFEEVKNRADSKLKIDISRAESWVIDYCNNRFDDPEKYPEIPENVKTAVLLIAEAYAHNAVEQTKSASKARPLTTTPTRQRAALSTSGNWAWRACWTITSSCSRSTASRCG